MTNSRTPSFESEATSAFLRFTGSPGTRARREEWFVVDYAVLVASAVLYAVGIVAQSVAARRAG
ncbi:hypothetical protein ABT262_43460, partial [Amycolatopsis mediterranei]